MEQKARRKDASPPAAENIFRASEAVALVHYSLLASSGIKLQVAHSKHDAISKAFASLENSAMMQAVAMSEENQLLLLLACVPAQLWPKTLFAIAVEALVEQKQAGGKERTGGKLPTKGEVTAWLAACHRRGAVSHTDKLNRRLHRRIRSVGSQLCFETLDQEQDGLCVHETILAND